MRLLDTDTSVELLRARPEDTARYAATEGEIVTTWITAAELMFGACKSKSPEKNVALVERFLDTLPVLGPSLSSVRHFGRIKASLAREGQMVADADLLIASIALAHGATLVTGNRRHFTRIPGLLIEDRLRPLAANQAP